jgi:TonB family protein
VFGDVRLRLTVDAETGAVTNVEVIQDKPLLGAAAVAAARQWMFTPATAPREPIDVTFRFAERCPPDQGPSGPMIASPASWHGYTQWSVL